VKADLYSVAEWLRRVGTRRLGWAPEFADHIQPVQVIGDASSLATPLVPALFYSGVEFTSNVARTVCCEFRAGGAGGAFIRALRIAHAGLIAVRSVIRDTPATMVGSSLGTVRAMNPEQYPTTASGFRGGDVAAALTGLQDPTQVAGSYNTHIFDDLWYVPPGKYLYLEANAVGVNTVYAFITWQDAPA